MNNITKNILTGTNEVIVTAASVAAGTTTAVYCIEHDVCNNEETSLIVGATAGATTTALTSLAIHSIEAGVLALVSKIKARKNS